jgi:DNA transformation protein and related proteins
MSSLNDHLAEVLAPLGPIRIRRMFGGAGVYCGDVMFALTADEVLYFKGLDAKTPPIADPDTQPFIYGRDGGRSITMSYWRAPERLLDDDDELLTWARAALDIAQRAAKPKSKSPPKPATRKPATRASGQGSRQA